MEARGGGGLDLEDEEEVEVEADRLNVVHVVDDFDGLNSIIVLLIGFRLQLLKLKLIIDVVVQSQRLATTFASSQLENVQKCRTYPSQSSFHSNIPLLMFDLIIQFKASFFISLYTHRLLSNPLPSSSPSSSCPLTLTFPRYHLLQLLHFLSLL